MTVNGLEHTSETVESEGATSLAEKSQTPSPVKEGDVSLAKPEARVFDAAQTKEAETPEVPRLYKDDEVEAIVTERASKLAQSMKDKELLRIEKERQEEEQRKIKAQTEWRNNHLMPEEEQQVAKEEKETLDDLGLTEPTPSLKGIFAKNRESLLLLRTGQGYYAEMLKDKAVHKTAFREVAATNLAIELGLPDESRKVLDEITPLKFAILEAVTAREKKYGRDLTDDEIQDIAKIVHYDLSRKPKEAGKTARPPVSRPDNNVPGPVGGESLARLTPVERLKRRDELIRQGKK